MMSQARVEGHAAVENENEDEMLDGDLGRVETWGGEPGAVYGDVSGLVNGDWSV